MRSRTKSNKKKFTPLLYAAFFVVLPLCAALYLSVSARSPVSEDTLRIDREDIMGGQLWQNPNTVIYRPLDNLIGYTSQDYYEEHPEIWLSTPEGDYCIHLLGGREIPSDAPFFHPESQIEAEIEMLHVMEKSTFIAPAQIRGQLVTLCANMDETSESCFVVFGLTK